MSKLGKVALMAAKPFFTLTHDAVDHLNRFIGIGPKREQHTTANVAINGSSFWYNRNKAINGFSISCAKFGKINDN